MLCEKQCYFNLQSGGRFFGMQGYFGQFGHACVLNEIHTYHGDTR